MLLLILFFIYTLSGVCADSAFIDLETLNVQQSVVRFYQKCFGGEEYLFIQSKKDTSGLSLSISDRNPNKASQGSIVSLRCLDIDRSGDNTAPFGSIEIVLEPYSGNFLTCTTYAGSHSDAGSDACVFSSYGEMSFLTESTNLANVVISKITECDGVATVQYSLPQDVDENSHSFCVTAQLDMLPAFTLSGHKNEDEVFKLIYGKTDKKPQGFA